LAASTSSIRRATLPAGVASSRRKTASRATIPRRRTFHPSRALFDARSLRTGYPGLPPGGFRSEGGTERRLAHADHSRSRRRGYWRGTGSRILAKPSQEGRSLQAGLRPFAHGGTGHGMASRRPEHRSALVCSGGQGGRSGWKFDQRRSGAAMAARPKLRLRGIQERAIGRTKVLECPRLLSLWSGWVSTSASSL
jgi:hypothetical protein